jgi:hypothetical protein
MVPRKDAPHSGEPASFRGSKTQPGQPDVPRFSSGFRALACRALASSGLLTLVLLAVSGVDSPSGHALTLPPVRTPAVSVPTVIVPPISVPSIPTPVGNTPPVSTPPVSTPGVSTPPVSVPNAGNALSGQAGSLGLTSTSSSAGGQTGSSQPGSSLTGFGSASQSSGSGSSGASGVGSRGARDAGSGSARVTAAARQRQRQRRLRRLVNRLSGCLSTLTPQAKQVLVLRAGIGSNRAYTGGQVARMLHIGAARETRVEQAALTTLQAAAKSGSCGANMPALIQVPAQDRLVSVSPALLGSSQGQSGVLVSSGGSAVSARSATRASGKSGNADARPSGRGNTALQNGAVLQLRTPNSSAAILVFGAFALIGALALLSALGRRIAAREQLSMLAAAAAPASRSASTTALAPVPAPSRPATPSHPAAAAVRDKWTLGEAATAATSTAPIEPAAPVPLRAQTEAIEPPAPAAPRPLSESLAAAQDTLVDTQASRTSQDWLRAHRSQIALVFTALAGGALRLFVRDRHRR